MLSVLVPPYGLPEPETMVLPSGLMATLSTGSVCPFNVLLTSPDARSHTLVVWEGFGVKFSLNSKPRAVSAKPTHRTVLSPEPETIVVPSGLIATLFTPYLCPFSVVLHSPVVRSHTLVVWEGFGGKF